MENAPVVYGYRNDVLPLKLAIPLAAPRAVALCLPGAAYTQDRPLLVAARDVLVGQGAECLLSERYYGMDRSLSALTGEERENCLSTDSGALGRASFERAAGRPVWLVGKSIGTTCLAHALKQVPDLAQSPVAWLTPLWKDDFVYKTIAALGERSLVLIGTADPQWDTAVAEKLSKKKVQVIVVEGADHSMVVAGNTAATDGAISTLRSRLQALVNPPVGP